MGHARDLLLRHRVFFGWGASYFYSYLFGPPRPPAGPAGHDS